MRQACMKMKRRTTPVNKKITNFSTQKLITKIMTWGTALLFLAALGIMAYLSFVTNVDINPSVKNITLIAMVALVLNFIVWESRHRAEYDRSMLTDITNEKYSVHRRYYFARKGLKQTEVQSYIRQYNKDYVQAWLDDVVDETGRTIEEITNEPYRGHDHKLLIYKVKHHKYPKSGIKRAREVLSVLNVSGSDSMKINLHSAEHQHLGGAIRKVFTSLLSTLLAASVTVNFVEGDLSSAFLTLILNIVILFTSLFFGTISGAKAAKMKLSIAETVSELLEEWRKQPPKEEPFIEHVPSVDAQPIVKPEVKSVQEEKRTSVIEIS